MPSAPPDGLTPFVSRLESAAEEAARALLDLDPEAPVRLLSEDGAVQVVCTLEDGLTVDLGALDPERRAWVAGGRFALSYRRLADGSDPHGDPASHARLQAVAERFRAADPTDRTGPSALVLADALEALVPWVGITDGMYRQISQGAAGTVATLRLGFRCNQDCYFCWQDRDWPEPPAEYYFTWLEEMAAQGCERISISGGEPTLHRSLPDLVAQAHGVHGMSVTIQTNAIQLRRPEYLGRLMEAGLGDVFVSYHSADPEVSDAMTRAPRTYPRTVEGIEACLAAGLPVGLNCVVDQRNVDTLEHHAKEVTALFVRPFPDNPVREVTYTFPSRYYDAEAWSRGILPLDTVRPTLVAAVKSLVAAGVRVQVLGTCGFPPCAIREVPEVIWSIDPEGVDALDREGRAYGEVCESCAMRPSCMGVRREYLEVYGERGLVPFERRPEARTAAS